jgi:hypothetical protein
MRTDRSVMLLVLFFFACRAVPAQETGAESRESVDADVTIIGRDETIIPIPPPPHEWRIELPALDARPFASQAVPAIQPPVGEWYVPWSNTVVITVYYLQESPT